MGKTDVSEQAKVDVEFGCFQDFQDYRCGGRDCRDCTFREDCVELKVREITRIILQTEERVPSGVLATIFNVPEQLVKKIRSYVEREIVRKKILGEKAKQWQTAQAEHRQATKQEEETKRRKNPRAKTKAKVRRWTYEETQKLIELYTQGKPLREIAESLNRSYRAVEKRLYKLREEGVVGVRVGGGGKEGGGVGGGVGGA
ncbi:hypothetical protein Ferp_0579 [Ferroglobus placidus DSM 10642]|uniref:Uncharacterized protein n=1 Tax=Ferroglobus placidus (strain DSM 10642 / AEDII12DO) TaxID=589924 RepID=D3S3B9_FERPA|nr:hypothetical protein [Ferroglobus placidus]ADC64752.1 hypothetical protein Ferp_0579 [Ferroglobus placidus DSM 10642]